VRRTDYIQIRVVGLFSKAAIIHATQAQYIASTIIVNAGASFLRGLVTSLTLRSITAALWYTQNWAQMDRRFSRLRLGFDIIVLKD
jgi:hypothetical protein